MKVIPIACLLFSLAPSFAFELEIPTLYGVVDTFPEIQKRILRSAWSKQNWGVTEKRVSIFEKKRREDRLRIEFELNQDITYDSASSFSCQQYIRVLPPGQYESHLRPKREKTNYLAVVEKALRYTVSPIGIIKYPPVTGTIHVTLPLRPKTLEAIFPSQDERILSSYPNLDVEDVISTESLEVCQNSLEDFLGSRIQSDFYILQENVHDRPSWHHVDTIITHEK